ncbi:hypothetical protein [Granulicella sp. dw_53]|uniref:hypothetical protein n=1 Tax=Granulicella sp. dw_53 TaxID=2719792 RepID=UPI001BD43AAA|nr:hypothetical protein [Granulicella sp. dw_53]
MRTKFAAEAIFTLTAALLLPAAAATAAAQQQQRPLVPPAPVTTPHRTRLILKDGSYQIVMSYRIVGNVVRYVSAERGGAEEEVPTELVDLDATRKWEARHTAAPEGEPGQAPPIDPELLKEEADRAALTPEVATDLRLPEEDSVLALDTFRGTPELVPLAQSGGELNRNTAHNILRATINPLASSHQLIQLKGEKAAIQLHVNSPVLYLRVGDFNAPPTGGPPLVVDTHGATGQAPSAPAGGSPDSRYVIVRTDVRTGARVVASFKINMLGGVRRQEDVVETTTELLPGGHWMKISPKQPLDFGEFALMEIISEKEVNLGVWDFGVHPVAPENPDALKPQPKRPLNLERRRPS